LQQYKEPFDAFCDSFEAGWRAVWADVCKQKGETVPFEQWFYATDANGDCPFEIAGAHIRGTAPRDEPSGWLSSEVSLHSRHAERAQARPTGAKAMESQKAEDWMDRDLGAEIIKSILARK
jgi:hypothetical protein